MKTKIEFVPDGTVTTPKGFCAGATRAEIKEKTTKLDLGILFSEESAVASGLFTANRIKSAPVVLSRERLKRGQARAVIVNSGNANASTGEQGRADALQMTELAAKALGIPPEEVLVASTGVIGQLMPMKKIAAGIERMVLSARGGHELAQAMMTTDTQPKEVAVKVSDGDSQFTIGGVAKGAGMIHPNLATMLCFLTTDAVVEPEFLRQALKQAAGVSFNLLSVDGDTSPSDTLLLLANGRAKNETISAKSRLASAFQEALEQVCIHLAKSIARDGEGATKLMEVTVSGARTPQDARLAARTIVSSSLVKTAVYGNDPNWGRVVAALGRSGAEVEESRIDLYLGDLALMQSGRPLPFNWQSAVEILDRKEVYFRLNLNLGESSATAWGCDLTEEYVRINSKYTT